MDIDDIYGTLTFVQATMILMHRKSSVYFISCYRLHPYNTWMCSSHVQESNEQFIVNIFHTIISYRIYVDRVDVFDKTPGDFK